jgi:hypothetical protein
VSQVAIPYPSADGGGDSRVAAARYAIPYPSADVDGDGPTLFPR